MSTDLTMAEAEHDQIRRWLGALREAGDDFERFVGEQLDHLEALRRKIDDRELELDRDREMLRLQINSLHASQERLDQASAATEKWIGQQREPSAAAAPESTQALDEIVAEMRREREHFSLELASAQSQAQAVAQAAAADMAQARAELQAASEELQRERQNLVASAAPLVAAASDYAAALRQAPATPVPPAADKVVPPIVTRRPAPLAAEPAMVAVPKAATPNAEPPSAAMPREAASGDDPAISSILQQFESLQQDLAGRRPAPLAKVPQ